MEEKTLLPDELKIEILLRLSSKFLLKFKSVCRNWYFLIESSMFITRYSHISHARDNNTLLFFRRDPIKKTFVVSLIDRQTNKKVIDLEWPPFLDEGIDNKDDFDRVINVLGPVNGIYCIFNRLHQRWVGTLVLWNPATREYKHVNPRVAFPFSFDFLYGKWPDNHWYYESKRPMGMYLGFGLSNRSNDLKVVVICYWSAFDEDDDDRWHVKVYSLSTNSWKTIHYSRDDVSPLFEGMEIYFYLSSYPEFVHCHLNGVFHWSTSDGDILAFNMNDESFHLIKGPPLPRYHYPYRSVWVLKETLALVYSTYEEDNRIPCGAFVWMMMKYGVEDSWTRVYSVGPLSGLAVIGVPNNEIFFSSADGQLMSSDFEYQGLKEYDVYGLRESTSHPNSYGSQGVLKYVETFVLLNRDTDRSNSYVRSVRD